MDAVRRYVNKYCDRDYVMKDSEVPTREEQPGRDEILDGVKNKDWIVHNSDKSGRIVLDTKTYYLASMEEH